MNHSLKYAVRTDLILPEYGRNIQRMVEIAMTIEDRTERNRCARTIIDCMGNLFPYLRDVENYKHKLWHHLAVMSNFKLDIDYPYEIQNPENSTNIKPEKIEIESSKIKAMHYGRFIEKYAKIFSEDGELEKKEEAILILANHMKKSYTTWNKDIVDDSQIFDDLRELTNGKIDLKEENNKLYVEKRNNYNNYNNKKNNNNNNIKKR